MREIENLTIAKGALKLLNLSLSRLPTLRAAFMTLLPSPKLISLISLDFSENKVDSSSRLIGAAIAVVFITKANFNAQIKNRF